MREVGPGAAANPALVSAAAHACHTAAEGALGGDVSADLADALLDALRLLAAKDRLRFSPSLEHRCCASSYPLQLLVMSSSTACGLNGYLDSTFDLMRVSRSLRQLI